MLFKQKAVLIRSNELRTRWERIILVAQRAYQFVRTDYSSVKNELLIHVKEVKIKKQMALQKLRK